MNNRSKTATLLVTVQLVIVGVAAAVAFILSDGRAAAAAAAAAAIGGGICLITTVFFSLRVFVGQPQWSAEQFLRRFYRAEWQKALMAIVLLLAALIWLELPGLPLMLSFLAALMANWLILLIST